MKKIDIRTIYVCEILKQSKVRKNDNRIFLPSDYPDYSWRYEQNTQLGLFVQTLGRYKHILTDTIYPQPSRHTGNKYVINPNNIEKLVKRERALASHLIEKHKSFNIDISVIKTLEERINSDAQYTPDDENTLSN